MSKPNSGWSRRDHVEHDGVQYEITVIKRGEDFYAEWICAACGKTGGSSLASSTADKADARAQISLFAHHTLAHRAPPQE